MGCSETMWLPPDPPASPPRETKNPHRRRRCGSVRTLEPCLLRLGPGRSFPATGRTTTHAGAHALAEAVETHRLLIYRAGPRPSRYSPFRQDEDCMKVNLFTCHSEELHHLLVRRHTANSGIPSAMNARPIDDSRGVVTSVLTTRKTAPAANRSGTSG